MKRGDITAREAQKARYDIALKVKSSYHPGYVRPLELGGADFFCVCLSYFGGWRSPVGEVMPKVGHAGDNEPTHSHEERYGSRTWGDSTHNSQAGVFAGDHSSDGEFNVRLDGEQGEANAGGCAGCTRTRSAAQVAAAGGAVRQGGRWNRA